jgi:hypothetical protein
MKYSATLTREDGKTVLLAANEYIDIDVKAGSRYIARLRVNDNAVRDAYGNDINAPLGYCTFGSCKNPKWIHGDDDLCEKHYKNGINK